MTDPDIIAAQRRFILQLCERIYRAHEVLGRLAEKRTKKPQPEIIECLEPLKNSTPATKYTSGLLR